MAIATAGSLVLLMGDESRELPSFCDVMFCLTQLGSGKLAGGFIMHLPGNTRTSARGRNTRA